MLSSLHTHWRYLCNIGWPWGGYKNILPEMLTRLPELKMRAILLALRAIYSCIPWKRAIQYYYYLYRALCVILLSYDREWLPAAILSVYKQRVWSARMHRVIIVGHYLGHILLPRKTIILLPSLSQSPSNNDIIALLVTKRVEYTILSTKSPIWIIINQILNEKMSLLWLNIFILSWYLLQEPMSGY